MKKIRTDGRTDGHTQNQWPSFEFQVQGWTDTGYKVQGTKYRVQGTGYKVQGTK